MIVAIDGPAGAGKGTLGKKLAHKYNWAFLDTGLLYRAVAMTLLHKEAPLHDEMLVAETAHNIDFSTLDPQQLKQQHIGDAASRIAQFPLLRQALLQKQRDFAQHKQGAVLDGRDIGTFVLPGADLKFYITASLEERARRRHLELGTSCAKTLQDILEEVRVRDERDMNRHENPLRPADDAIIVDTTGLSIEQNFHILCHFVDVKLP